MILKNFGRGLSWVQFDLFRKQLIENLKYYFSTSNGEHDYFEKKQHVKHPNRKIVTEVTIRNEHLDSDVNDNSQLPEEPTTCCMSGCANCVWLDYAEKMTKYYKNGGEKAIKEINEKVNDPNIKAFLLQELKSRML